MIFTRPGGYEGRKDKDGVMVAVIVLAFLVFMGMEKK